MSATVKQLAARDRLIRVAREPLVNFGPYAPDNCVWATVDVQNNNKRSTHRLIFRNETKTLRDWCRELGVPHAQAYRRLRREESIEVVLSTEKLPRGAAAVQRKRELK